MNELSEIAAKWGANGQIELIAERENAVYKILPDGTPMALRLHRAGYQSEAAILSELRWTLRLAEAGFACPKPLAQADGSLLAKLADGRFVSVITWVEGAPIGAMDTPVGTDVTAHCDLYHQLGRLLAQLHETSDRIKTDDLTRAAWDLPGLLGKSPFWGRFWDNPSLSASEKKFMVYTRQTAHAHLSAMKGADFGLIHADALQENVFQTKSGLTLIDFDDAGFGYRGYDLGVCVSQHYAAGHLNDLIAAVAEGYGTLRKAPSIDDIKFFLMLRGLASCGWVIARQPKKSPVQRRYAERALHLAHQWLTTA
ncbi:MAG: phosphotransferase [Planktomarina temperata]|uniref:phosphotransferase enzyme family protein n=1 Tax=Planktomarina temperata TaxID=1284658 RepID=UPI003260271C|nr:phosphotransferase [Planktomarina temperata]